MRALQIEPVAWTVCVDAAPPLQVIDELHIAQNQHRIEKCLDFWMREKSFAAVLSDEWVASTRYGIDRRTGCIVWQTEPYFPRRFWWSFREFQQLGRKENVLIPQLIDGSVLIATSFGVNGKSVGPYQFNARTGALLRKPDATVRQLWHNPLMKRRDKRKRRNKEWVADLLGELKSSSANIEGWPELGGIGYLLHGTPSNGDVRRTSETDVPAFPVRPQWRPRPSLYPATPYQWFLQRDDESVAWTWDTRYLSEQLGDETILSSRRMKIYAPYLFYLHCVSVVNKEPEEEWEAIAAPFIVFVVAQDLRNGSISSIQQVGKEPILGPILEAVDENGLLIRSFDRRLFYLPITTSKND